MQTSRSTSRRRAGAERAAIACPWYSSTSWKVAVIPLLRTLWRLGVLSSLARMLEGGGGHGRPRVSLDFRRLPPLPHMHAAGSGHSMFQHAHLATGRTSTRPSALAVTESSAQPTSGFSSRCMIQRRQSKHSSGHHRPAHADHGPTNSPPWSGSASCNSRVDGPRRIQPKSPTLTRFPTQSTHPAATAS